MLDMPSNITRNYNEDFRPKIDTIQTKENYVNKKTNIQLRELQFNAKCYYTNSYDNKEHISSNGFSFKIKSELNLIANSIKNSFSLIDLKDDWDENGALGFNSLTYLNAISFLIRYSESIIDDYEIAIQAPEINLTRNSSIDLEWRTKNQILLINITNTIDNRFEIHYYGEDLVTNNSIKGVLSSDKSDDEDLKFWMRKLC